MLLSTNLNSLLNEQLLDRRGKLNVAAAAIGHTAELNRLLQEVDDALERMKTGIYGLCEVCHDPIEPERLMADPLSHFCLDHLSPAEQQALQTDLELAAKIQGGLLPERDLRFNGWEVAYHYEPAGIVSGDYCDLVRTDAGDLYFMVGDVSGKGVAAAMLMSQLHAMFRTLISLGLPLDQIIERASRVFCESTMASHYATLVCGRARRNGEVELCNAGHLPPLLSDAHQVVGIEASGLPLGMFSDERFEMTRLSLPPGSTLLVYTDGISEAENDAGEEYGHSRLAELRELRRASPPRELVRSCLADLAAFRASASKNDDLTILALRRE